MLITAIAPSWWETVINGINGSPRYCQLHSLPSQDALSLEGEGLGEGGASVRVGGHWAFLRCVQSIVHARADGKALAQAVERFIHEPALTWENGQGRGARDGWWPPWGLRT